jgi:two-component system OmpR family response regulator
MVQVLVVEDDRDTREVVRMLLEDADYTVAEARDGPEGLTAIRGSAVPLVVVLDFDLPHINGIELMQEVARDERLAGRHAFIMITAVSSNRYQAAAKMSSVASLAPLITKPFDVDDLLDQVAAAAHRLPPAA